MDTVRGDKEQSEEVPSGWDVSPLREPELGLLVDLDHHSDLPVWTAQDFRRLLHEPTSIFLVARRGPIPVGFICGRCVEQEGEILKIAVLECHRRIGAGRCLLQAFLDLLGQRGCSRVYLDVREGNRAAIALYVASGFCIVGRRKGYYRMPDEDALLMAKTLERLDA